MRDAGESEGTAMLPPGTRVEVRSRFDRSWARGFEIAEALEGAYRVRRVSDGSILPAEFHDHEVRVEAGRPRRRSNWWY